MACFATVFEDYGGTQRVNYYHYYHYYYY